MTTVSVNLPERLRDLAEKRAAEMGYPSVGEYMRALLESDAGPQKSGRAGEGLRRTFGGWGDDADGVDAFVEQVYRDRADVRPEQGE
jgi:hypothetical protein